MTRDIVARLSEQLGAPWPGLAGPVYVADGSTLLLPHTRKLAQAFPPGDNQHGPCHWPILRIVVLHDVSHGLALYPHWGPLHGAGAVSEQGLAAQALAQLPAGATVLADRNFGVFAVAWEVAQRQGSVVVRRTDVRAKKLHGGAIRQEGDDPVQWQASRWDQPQAAPWPAIYGQRWNIETDLRALKRTVQLQQIRSRSVDGLEKELLTAICAYNLVRAVMCLAARRSGIPARRLSFTRCLDVVNDAWPQLLAAPSQQAQNAAFEQLLDWIAAYKLPNRTKPRRYPREVWGHGYHFPARKTK